MLGMVTARLMETWAHGQDVADALGVRRLPTQRLRQVATLAVRARAEGQRVRGLPAPIAAVRVELIAPDQGRWCFGDRAEPQQRCQDGGVRPAEQVIGQVRVVGRVVLGQVGGCGARTGMGANTWSRRGESNP